LVIETMLAALAQLGPVHTGHRVPSSVLDQVERELGIRLPDDYRHFVAEYGYLYAAEGAFVVFGIPPDGVTHACEVDVRRAAKQLAAVAAERAARDPSLDAELATASPLVPVFGVAADFPSHQVYVLDRDRKIRWFLVDGSELHEETGVTFEELLADSVGARVPLGVRDALAYREDGEMVGSTYVSGGMPTRAVEVVHRGSYISSDEAAVDELTSKYAHDGQPSESRTLFRAPDQVVRAIAAEPSLFLTFERHGTRADLLLCCAGTRPDPAVDDPSVVRALAVTEGIGRTTPLVRNVGTLDDALGPLIFLLTGHDESLALAGKLPIARATSGDREISTEPTMRVLLAADVAALAPALKSIASEVRNAYSDEDDELAERLVGNGPDELIELAKRITQVFREAAKAGDGIIVRYVRN
jgi:hypothetical protein